MAEYEGLLAGLRAAVGLGIHHLLVKGDSQLVVNQVSKEYQCSDPQIAVYVAKVKRLEQHFDGLELHHIPRCDNTLADDLSHLASSWALVSAGTFEERLTRPSVPPADQDEGEPSSSVEGTQTAPSVGAPIRVSPPDECVALTGSPQESSWINEI